MNFDALTACVGLFAFPTSRNLQKQAKMCDMAEKKLSAGNRSHAKFSPKQAHLSSNRAVCCMWGPQLPTKTLAPCPRTLLLAYKLGKTAQNATCISKSSTVRKTHFQKGKRLRFWSSGTYRSNADARVPNRVHEFLSNTRACCESVVS